MVTYRQKMGLMKRILLALLLFSSPVLAEKERIYYVHTRPPSSYSGTIGDDGFFYYFTNSADCVKDEIIKLKINGACFIKTDVPAKIVKEGIMKTTSMYWCSEAVIQEAKKVQTPSPSNRFGYGICTENGWVFK